MDIIELVCREQSGTELIEVVPETGLEVGGVDIPAVGVHDDTMTYEYVAGLTMKYISLGK
jgi:hypothetical protein